MTDLTAVVAGPDTEDLGAELEALDVAVSRVDGPVTAGALDDAGIDDAALYVLTDLAEATSIAVAKERNPDLRVVVYSTDTLPEYAKGVADLAVDPDLLAADVVADELVAGA